MKTTIEMLDFVFNIQSKILKQFNGKLPGDMTFPLDELREANGYAHELIARLAKSGNTELESQTTEEPTPVLGVPVSVSKYKVFGVQVVDKGSIIGTALYAEQSDAKIIRDALNAKYAELRVTMESKIITYPILEVKK